MCCDNIAEYLDIIKVKMESSTSSSFANYVSKIIQINLQLQQAAGEVVQEINIHPEHIESLINKVNVMGGHEMLVKSAQNLLAQDRQYYTKAEASILPLIDNINAQFGFNRGKSQSA